jgi:hypothetical protein
MFRLLRLAVYGLVGYAAYQFVMDVVNADQSEAPSRGQGSRGGGRASTPITGAKRGGGAGKPEATHDSDGGSVRHRVGRGVV